MKIIAYFDVDDTLINIKSMFSFLSYLEENSDSELSNKVAAFAKKIDLMRKAKQPRNLINKEYYKIFEGIEVRMLNALGQLWFDHIQAQNDVFNMPIVHLLDEHKREGHKVVFVSGSFESVLRPIGDYLGVDRFICAPQEIEAGRFTGQLTSEPVIGIGKAINIKNHAYQQKAVLSNCYAYGDDITDIPMLKCVGNPKIINPDLLTINEYKKNKLFTSDSVLEI